jgi:hypothetical protein
MPARRGASDARSRDDDGGRRYRPRRMVARRASCSTAFGGELQLVVMGSSVVAPEAARREPGLAWLETEGHLRLSIEESRRLEDAVDGLRIGCWPYRAPVGRWNEAAELHPWLALAVRDDPSSPSHEVDVHELPAPSGQAVRRRYDHARPGRRLPSVDLLRAGLGGIGELVLGVRHEIRLLVLGLLLAACAYYAVATAAWLWQLRDGMSMTELQGGLALVVAAIVCSAVAGILGVASQRRTPRLARLGDTAALTCIRLWRAGIMLQLSALLGFLIW